jgi:hypothetical protein
MHRGFLDNFVEGRQSLGVAGVLRPELLDLPLHRRVEVVPPGFVRQVEVVNQRQAALPRPRKPFERDVR